MRLSKQMEAGTCVCPPRPDGGFGGTVGRRQAEVWLRRRDSRKRGWDPAWTLDSNKVELNVGTGSHLIGSLPQGARCHRAKGSSPGNSWRGSPSPSAACTAGGGLGRGGGGCRDWFIWGQTASGKVFGVWVLPKLFTAPPPPPWTGGQGSHWEGPRGGVANGTWGPSSGCRGMAGRTESTCPSHTCPGSPVAASENDGGPTRCCQSLETLLFGDRGSSPGKGIYLT